MGEKRLGRYQLEGLLGQGGMGSVFRARDTRLGRVVALKVMNLGQSASPDAIGRFEREGRSLASLEHPNIVTVYDFCELDGNLCMIMELVDGQPLDQIIDRRLPMTIAQRLNLMAWVCRALEYAHGKGVIHRDLKPGNILVKPNGSPKIVDFGIARMVGQDTTRASIMLGTVAYMAPEQINGTAVTPRTDVYAAGVTLFELLTGQQPFAGTDTAQTMRRILLDPTPRLPPSLPGVPVAVHEALQRSLEKEPMRRMASAAELASLLEAGAHQLASGEKPVPPLAQPSAAPQPSWQPPAAQPFVPAQAERHPSGPQGAALFVAPSPARHPSGPQPLGRPADSPVPGIPLGPTAFTFPNPPNLPWVVVLLIAFMTGGVGMLLWEMNVARWLKKVDPRSGAWTLSVIAAACFGGYWLMVGMSALSRETGHMAHDAGNYATAAGFAIIGYVVMVLVLRMNLRGGIERHFNTAEPIGLRLSGPMAFFFGGAYFAYHFNRINAQRMRMGRMGASA